MKNTATCKDQPPSSVSFSSVLQPYVDGGSLAGAVVLVADKERVISLDAVGFADVATKRPMRPDTMFWVASQSKPITATALMMLVDEGKVNVEDPVEKYLPEFAGLWLAAEQDEKHILLKKPHRAITLCDMLTHTSGMVFSSAIEKPSYDGLSLRVGALSYATTPLATEPGSKYQYSNMGINTIGRIIELVSGKAFEDFLDERIFGPLEMMETTFWPSEAQVSRLATSYRTTADKTGIEPFLISQLMYPLSDRTRQPIPAGGLFSTVADCARFCQMILNGGVWRGRRYISQASIAAMTHKQTPEAITEGYGLGWQTGPGTFGHGGAHGTRMTVDVVRGLISVFLVQCINIEACRTAFTNAVAERFAGKSA